MSQLLTQLFAPGISRVVALVTLLAAAALVCLSLVFNQAVADNESAETTQARATQLIDVLRETQQHLLEMQASNRDYLLTGKEEFLSPMEKVRRDLHRDREQLQESSIDAESQQQAIDNLLVQQQEYEDDWVNVLIATAQRDRELAVEMVATGEGRERMETMQQLIERIITHEKAQLRQAQQKSDAAEYRTKSVAAGALLAVLTGVLITFVLIHRGLVQPLHKLALGARRICQGDLATRVKARDAQGEIGQLVRDFNQMAADLQQSEQMKEDFIALVSHELRTPLAAIIIYIEDLQSGELDTLDDDQRELLNVIDRNAKRLMRLVGDLLFLADLGAMELQVVRAPMQLHQVAAESVRDIQERAQAKQIDVTLETEPIEYIGDSDRLGQVIDNLLSNAVKFTPEYGQVHVTVREAGNYAQISVQDNGMGIAKKDQAKVFQRFYRTKQAAEQAIPGTGLGLVITKSIVEAHDGSIEIESKLDEGTKFLIELPLTRHIGGRAS